MGNNFKFGYNFTTYVPTASSESTAYPDDNLTSYQYPIRAFHSGSSAELTISCNLGSSKSIIGTVLNDVNFTSFYTAESTNGTTWAAESSWTVPLDERVNRYKIFAATTHGSQYLRIRIPAQTATDGSTYYRVGSLVFLNTVLELTYNPAEPYEYSADQAVATTKMPSGSEEDVVLGDAIWEGSFSKPAFPKTAESDYWTLNQIGKSQPLVFFENTTDLSKCYICKRRSAVVVQWKEASISGVQTLTFKEIR